jgi:hypothetical protein
VVRPKLIADQVKPAGEPASQTANAARLGALITSDAMVVQSVSRAG